ncbi:MAG: hypothetical protein WA093_01035 [Minisyncoccales bacterium]
MLWLYIAIGSYILLAATALIDKILLGGSISNPKLYAFYIGILSAVAFLLLPFGAWASPAPALFLIGVAAGAAQIYGSYFYLSALGRFEASRVVPIIGSLVPIFGFFLTALVSGGKAVLELKEMAGFFLLIAGSWLIMAKGISFKRSGFLWISMASLLFASSVVLSKLVYLRLAFLGGFLLVAFGSVAAALSFLLSGDVRKTVFGHHSVKKAARPNFLFFIGQIAGGAAFLLQSLAVSLAPQANVPVINAMAGIQYISLFVLSIIISIFLPGILKEKVNSGAVVQKAAAIALIMLGLAIFALN